MLAAAFGLLIVSAVVLYLATTAAGLGLVWTSIALSAAAVVVTAVALRRAR